jgi:hypothetical protein
MQCLRHLSPLGLASVLPKTFRKELALNWKKGSENSEIAVP